jgi:hypothetical protein
MECNNCGVKIKKHGAIGLKAIYCSSSCADKAEGILKVEDKKFDYYVKGFTPYEIIRAYPHIVDPAVQHAFKKLLRMGQSIKSEAQDLDEVIASLIEYKEYLASDDRKESE